jgi:hypothetical protein
MKILTPLILFIFSFTVYANELQKEVPAVILGSGIKLHTEPNEASRILNVLEPYSVVKIIKWSKDPEILRSFNDKWAYILTKEGQKGYVFGAYIFESDVLFVKKWEQKTRSGSAKIIYTFKKDMTFVYESFTKSGRTGEVKKIVLNGTFTLSNRGIRLVGEKIKGELFFFRYKGKNALSSLMFTPDNNVPYDFLYF